jgi:hypothetical protein
MADQDIYLQADGILSDNERNAFLKNFTKLNPHWDGAHVADILSELTSTDAHCGELDDLHERMADELGSKYLSVAGLLCAYVDYEVGHVLIGDSRVKNFVARLKNKHGN